MLKNFSHTNVNGDPVMNYGSFSFYASLLLFNLFLLLTACATNPYIEPVNGQAVATIKGIKTGTGMNNFEISTVAQIDGKNTNGGWDKEILVTPGVHQVGIETVYVHNFLQARFRSYSTVSASFKAGNHYQVNKLVEDNQTSIWTTHPEKNKVSIWIVDENGKKVSSISTMSTVKDMDPIILPAIR